MSRSRLFPARKRTGAAAVELALVAPLLLILLIGIWEIGRIVEVNQIIANAAREGGRQAMAGSAPAQVETVMRSYLTNAGLPSAAVGNAAVSCDDQYTTSQGSNAYKVTVSVPYRDVAWVSTWMFLSQDRMVYAESICARD